MQVLQFNKGNPYYTYKQVADMTGKSDRTVTRRVSGIREEIKRGRYSPYALPEKGVVNFYVYIDYSTYEKMLKDKNLRKAVPPFSPEEIDKICCYNKKLIDLDRAVGE